MITVITVTRIIRDVTVPALDIKGYMHYYDSKAYGC